MKKLHLYILTVCIALIFGFTNVSARVLSNNYDKHNDGQKKESYDLRTFEVLDYFDVLSEEDGEMREPEYSSSSKMCVSCGNGAIQNIPQQLPMFIRNIVLVLQLLVPVILVGLGIYDFVRAVASGDEKVMQESKNRFIKRIIAGVLIFFVTAIVKFVFALIPNSVDVVGCVPCFISSADNCSSAYTCTKESFNSNVGDVTEATKDNDEPISSSGASASQIKSCGDRGNVSDCNKDGKCQWNYSGNFCETVNQTKSCGNRGNVSDCNKDGKCKWNYSGNFCEKA